MAMRCNPSQIVVSHEQGGTPTTIPRLASKDACASGGWYYDDPTNPTTVILCPDTCSSIAGGTITIHFGCLTAIE